MGLIALHVLRFVHDNDGIGGLDKFDGPATGKPVVLLVDDVILFLVKGIDIDDQRLQLIAGGKLPQPGDLFGIVDP